MRKKALISFIALLLQCQASPPLALHQLIDVESGGEVVLLLHGVDFEGDDVSYILKHSIIIFMILIRSRLFIETVSLLYLSDGNNNYFTSKAWTVISAIVYI